VTIILPSGYRINLENQTTYSPGSTTTVVFTFAVGIGTGTWTETFLTSETAANFLLQLDALIGVGGAGRIGITNLTGSPTTLFSVSPNPFAMHGGGYILVNGSRFDPDTIGLLYLNDVGTAPDFNGYVMACTYISPTQVSARWISDGTDTNVLSELIAYYRDSNNLVSNVLTGVLVSDVAALTFTSVTPNTASVGDQFMGNVAGTGFAAAGIPDFLLDDGAGNQIGCLISGGTDVLLSIVAVNNFTVAGVYTLYYPVGAGYVTTGLTVTVT